MDGSRYRDTIASPYEWSFAFKPLTAEKLSEILALLDPDQVTVRFTDPESREVLTSVYYVDEVPAAYLVTRTDGTEYWGGLKATFSSKAGRFL